LNRALHRNDRKMRRTRNSQTHTSDTTCPGPPHSLFDTEATKTTSLSLGCFPAAYGDLNRLHRTQETSSGAIAICERFNDPKPAFFPCPRSSTVPTAAATAMENSVGARIAHPSSIDRNCSRKICVQYVRIELRNKRFHIISHSCGNRSINVLRSGTEHAKNQACATRDPKGARRLLEKLARRLEPAYPSAAASFHEGLDTHPVAARVDEQSEPLKGEHGKGAPALKHTTARRRG
jgi:hypothetical protein